MRFGVKDTKVLPDDGVGNIETCRTNTINIYNEYIYIVHLFDVIKEAFDNYPLNYIGGVHIGLFVAVLE